jgi:protein O-mannosyl-transferase
MSRKRPQHQTHTPSRSPERKPASLQRPLYAEAGARNRTLLICGGLIILTLLTWIRVARNGFVNYDDGIYVTENPHIKAGLTWKTISWAFTSIDEANWHPLTWLSDALDYQVFGPNAAGHHLVSLALHVANVVLLFWLLYEGTRQAGRSFLVAALFAIHPLNVESVAWVAERKNVLCTLFFFLAIAAYGRFVRKPDIARNMLMLVLFALALASKPMAVTLPCLLLLLDVWPLQRIQWRGQKSAPVKSRGPQVNLQSDRPNIPPISFSRAVVEKLPLFALTIASSVVTFYAQRYGGAILPSATELPIGLRIENAIRAYAVYIAKAFFPTGLAPIYPHPGNGILSWQVALSAIFLSAVSFWVWTKRTHAPYLLVGWLWFLGSLVPVVGIVQVGKQAMADRYTYIPLIGLFVMIVWGAADLADRTSVNFRWRGVLSVIAMGALSFLTWRQIGFWRNSNDLWTHTLAVTTNNKVAETNLSGALVEEGRLDEAIPHFENILRMDPQDATSYANIGAELQKQGKLNDAITSYRLALMANPKPSLRAGVYVNLWTIYTKLENFDVAEQNFEQALVLEPDLPAQLIPSFLQSVNTHPTPQNFLQLGELLQKHGNLSDARAAYQRCLDIDPNFMQAKVMLAKIEASAK